MSCPVGGLEAGQRSGITVLDSVGNVVASYLALGGTLRPLRKAPSIIFLRAIDKVDTVDMVEPTTTIRVKESTKRRLESLGTMGDSFDSLINRIINEREKGKETAGETRSVPGIFHDVFPVDEVVEILSKPTRRDVLRVLKDDRGTV